jgi:uncharacterized membrane protein
VSRQAWLPRALLGVATAGFAAGFTGLALIRHAAFWSGRFDLGNLTQAVWSTAHGRFLEMTDLNGQQISRLGAHFDPLVAALAPLWLAWPDPALLLVVQAVAVALGALPVFLLARRHLGGEWPALAFALGYLLYAPTQWLVVDDFHPVALGTPLLLTAFWLLDTDRLAPFAVVAALACLTKEHIGLVVAAMGIWYAVARRRRAGLAVAVAGIVASVVAIAVVVPHFAPGGGSPFESRYESVGGSPRGIAHNLVTDPGQVLGALVEGRDLRYLFHLLVPLAFLSLLGIGATLTAMPEILLNVLSDAQTQTSIHFHYTAGAIPGVVVGAVLGAGRLAARVGDLGPALARALVGVSLVATVAYGPVPLWSHLPFGQHVGATQYRVTARSHVAARAARLVPASAAVSASNTMGAHLSARRRVFSFPVVREARWIAVDTFRMSYRDDNLAHRRGLRALRQLLASGNWRVVFAQKGIVVLHRDGRRRAR